MNSRMKDIVAAIRAFRLGEAGLEEAQIQDALHAHLLARGLPSQREVKLAPQCRVDILVDGIVVELKKKRPPTATVYSQLERYARIPSVIGLVLVLERSVLLPEQIHGVPLTVVSLNSLWGIAL